MMTKNRFEAFDEAKKLGSSMSLMKIFKQIREVYGVNLYFDRETPISDQIWKALGQVIARTGKECFKEGIFRGQQVLAQEIGLEEEVWIPPQLLICNELGAEVKINRRVVEPEQKPDKETSTSDIKSTVTLQSSKSELSLQKKLGNENTVIINNWTNVVHRPECTYVRKMRNSNRMPRNMANYPPYRPCSFCRPFTELVGLHTGKLHFKDCHVARRSRAEFHCLDLSEGVEAGYRPARCCLLD